MEEQIAELDWKLDKIYVEYMVFQKDNVKKIKELLPDINRFAVWFLGGNQFGVEEELYQDMVCDMSGILKDITDAVENGDKVLLHDALAYGMSEYLRLFLPEKEEMEHESDF